MIKTLEKAGADKIAGMPGGANLPLYDAIGESRLKHTLIRHEQAAGFIAQGEARVSGKTALCIATSGPGALNLMTAIADAYMDSIPILAITGQVPTALSGTRAFQETSTTQMSRHITKATYAIEEARDAMQITARAYFEASSGRPGPILIDFPKDLQKQLIDVCEEEIEHCIEQSRAQEEKKAPREEDVKLALKMIAESERPLIYCGGGLRTSNSYGEVKELAERIDAYISATIPALGGFLKGEQRFLGIPGMHGFERTNLAFEEADLIIAAGARFDDRAAGKISDFCPKAKIIHIDIDPDELNKLIFAECCINADLKETLKALNAAAGQKENLGWRRRIEELKRTYPVDEKSSGSPDAYRLMKLISKSCAKHEELIVSSDVGQHQMWAAQHFDFYKAANFLNSCGAGTMGFGLPAAIGAALENPNAYTLCISGDGSIMMNVQELATLKESGANVKLIVLNNRHLGLVRQQQDLFFGGRKTAVRFEEDSRIFEIAKAFGIRSARIDCRSSFADAASEIERFLSGDGPALIEIMIGEDENVFPIVAPGEGNSTMICSMEDIGKKAVALL